MNVLRTFVLSITMPMFVFSAIAKDTPPKDLPKIDESLDWMPLINKVWSILDGFIIRKDAIGLALQAHLEMQKIRIGDISKDKHNPQGLYLFEGEYHSVKSLAKLESEYYLAHTEGTLSDSEYAKKNVALHVCLIQAKQDFEQKVSKFLEPARQAKDYLIYIIKDCCRKRNHPDSLLLTWGQAEEGKETKFFAERVTSFMAMDEFLGDMLALLKDILDKCPRAKQEFLDFVKRSKHTTEK